MVKKIPPENQSGIPLFLLIGDEEVLILVSKIVKVNINKVLYNIVATKNYKRR
jgi:hypothetical protein